MKFFVIILISISVSLIFANQVSQEENVNDLITTSTESTSKQPDEELTEQTTKQKSSEQGSDEKNSDEKDEDDNKSDEKEDEKEDEDEIDDEHKHPFGKPINLMKFDENENIIIDDDALNRTFMHPDVKDRKIIAVSIIGAFRKGKSFLMDYALRYMYANYKSVANPNNTLENKQNWIGDPEEPLKGFSWRGGSVRDTTGVVLWSDVFLHELKDSKTKKNEKLAIILMDTQGLFDTSTSPTDNSRIFALGTLMSSLQIYNLNDVILENQLEYLHMATDFAKFAANKTKEKGRTYKPFQTLIFLMRDWQNPQEFEYGSVGGTKYLAETLTISPTQPKELQEVRQYITESFNQRLCFLLPHPGSKAVNNKNYDGRFSELDQDFQVQLKIFLEWLLGEANLKKKKILGNEVTGAEYLEYIDIYFKAFQSNEIPEVQTLHGITVKKHYDIIIEESLNEYKNKFVPIEFKNENEWKNISVLKNEMEISHKNASKMAIKIYRNKKKLGSKEEEKKFEEDLKSHIKAMFVGWKEERLKNYIKFKDLEMQKQRDLDDLSKKKDEELKKMQEQTERRRLEMEEEHRNKTEQLEGTIANVKNHTDFEMEKLKEKFRKDREEAEKKQLELQATFEAEKQKIQQAAIERENEFRLRLAEMERDMKMREEESRRLILNKQTERLEALNKEAELKRKEFERQMQMADNKELALQAQRQYELEFKMKENRILAEKIEEENENLRKLDEDRRRKNKLFEEQLFESMERARLEELEAKRLRDLEHMRLMNYLRSLTTTTYRPPTTTMSTSKKILCGFTLGLACLF